MRDPFDALFEPRGVVIVGVSSHPGKFGLVAYHNLLAAGYAGQVFPVTREGGEVLGRPTLSSIDEVPEGTADLLVVCTPPATVPDLLRQAAGRGIRAVFLTTAGYGEAGEAGAGLQDELVALASDLGLLIAGPNGQGVVSTPVGLCAQIVAPIPPRGRISVVSQSGNLVSSFLNHAVASGVGIARAVSAGNAAVTGVIDYLEYFARDPETSVALCYLEGMGHGRDEALRLREVTARIPVVVVKGGATDAGARAAASHTGSLASDDRIVDGVLRQAGALRVAGIEEAVDLAAALASSPPPPGNRVVVLTTVGGWGVLTADAVRRSPHLELVALPPDLRSALDERLPPRWSRNNPIDLAGGETRDTVPEVLELVAGHPEVDAVLFMGLGIQSNQAAVLRSGPFWPDHGLERIAAFHERQDQRYAEAAIAVSDATSKPVLVATELAVTHRDNPGPAVFRSAGRPCFPSPQRAVAALEGMVLAARRRSESES